MMEKNNIPKHWQVKKLGEVCHTTSGGTPNRSNSKYYEGKIPWVKSGELDKGIILDTEEKISEEAIKNSSAKIFPKGTLLIALYGATIGKLAFLGIEAATNQAVCGIFKSEEVDSDYLFNFLSYKRPTLVKQGIGGAQPNISQGILKNLDVPLPPLPEQHAIVSKIEELFSELENGKRQLQTALQQLKVYRQSLLKAAFEGKLTNKNIKDGELPKGWKIVTIDEIGKVKGGKRLPKGEAYSEEPTKYPYLRVTDFENQTINQDKLKYLTTTTQAQIKNYIISKDDVFISIAGTIGSTGTIPENLDGANLTENAAKVTDLKNVYNKYLSQFLASTKGQVQIKEHTKTTTQPKLSLFRIEKIRLPLPSMEEQKLIVQELESKLTVCDKIEETITLSLQQAETLRQSILKQAFEGKLVTIPYTQTEETLSLAAEQRNVYSTGKQTNP